MVPLPFSLIGKKDRYSVKNTAISVTFFCVAPGAKRVSLIGDFNGWHPNAHPMRRHDDGSWYVQVKLNHGHHRYVFLVDGIPMLDPRAQGVTRNERNQRVSLNSVS